MVVASSKKLLVLRYKKDEECQCPWKLRVMLVKDTCLFVINKYKGPHICVNLYLNWDHHQLDSNLVDAHMKSIIKAQFTFVYICYSSKCDEDMKFYTKGRWMKNIKHLRHLFCDFSQSYTKLSRLFLALE